MQKISTPLFLVSVFLIVTSFKLQNNPERYKNTGYFFAIADGKMFEMRDNDKYTAELMTKSGSLNNKTSELNRAAVSLIFFGNRLTDETRNSFEESINFEYSFNDGTTGAANNLKIDFNFEGHNYYQIPEHTRFEISKIEWSDDHKNCLVTANFNCEMRRWGFPSDTQPTVQLKGRMVNINVTVPPWIASKINVQASIGQ